MCLELVALEDRTLPAPVLSIAALGDSLTHTYAANAGALNWVQQLRDDRAHQIHIQDLAVNGATSGSVFTGGQPQMAVQSFQEGKIRGATLEVGGNDEKDNLAEIAFGLSQNFVNTVVANIEQDVGVMTQAGIQVVLGDVPDIALTPAIKAALNNDPAKEANVKANTDAINQQLFAFADANRIPVADVDGLLGLSQQPLLLGGVTVTDFFRSDGFHPGTVLQGLAANTFAHAFQVGFGYDVSTVVLSDQDILTLANIQHPPAQTYYDVLVFVYFNGQFGH